MLSNVQIITKDDGTRVAIAFGYSPDPLLADESHPNFKAIVGKWLNDDATGFADLFDIPAAITAAFSRLSERVTVKDGNVFFDGDPAHGHVVDAILAFMDEGQDVSPLVSFYEKLTTNPLGNVQDGIFSWITGQKADGNFTITPEGNILGYKSVRSATPEWRTDQSVVYTPSRRGEGVVNDREVSANEFIEQVAGDTVEMARSNVLNAPSQACGTGLHIGTWHYAKGFSGDTVLLVEFDPRDVVSLPDSSSDWKLRVCRYKVVGVVDAPLDVALYVTEAPAPAPEADDDLDLDTTVEDLDADVAEAQEALDDAEDELAEVEADEDLEDDEYDDAVEDQRVEVERARESLVEAQERRRSHGKGGPTSQSAKGNGLNPAQNPSTGQFDSGRPGSSRNASTGRFSR